MNIAINRSCGLTRGAYAATLLACLALSACKTTESLTRVSPPAPDSLPPATTYQPRIEEDSRYITHVEQMARRRGVLVKWVNKPHKRTVDQD